jgi:hypothetical protein
MDVALADRTIWSPISGLAFMNVAMAGGQSKPLGTPSRLFDGSSQAGQRIA